VLRFGSHLSVAGGLYRAVEAAQALGFDSVAIFTANQRQWRPKSPGADDVRAFRAALRHSTVRPVVSHASYLINLANPDPDARRRSVEAYGAELDRCAAMGVPMCVLHPGAHLGEGESAGLARVAEALDEVYAARPRCRVRTLLETTVGQGTCLGHRFEHLAAIIEQAACKLRLGVCLDTCHVHAAGYDIVSEDGYERTMAELRACVGASRLRCLHLNDSKMPRGSRRDRHEHIGRGTIRLAGFRNVVNDPRLAGLPAILETPKEDNSRGVPWDRINLRKLRGLIRK